MHSLYLSHLVEIADGSRHALTINSRIYAAFCVLPTVYNQLLAVEYRYTHAPGDVATNTTAIPCTIGAHDQPVFSGCHSQDLSTGASYLSMPWPRLRWLVKLYENLTYVRMRPVANVLNYSVKDIRNCIITSFFSYTTSTKCIGGGWRTSQTDDSRLVVWWQIFRKCVFSCN